MFKPENGGREGLDRRGTLGCAACKGILFSTSSLGNGVLLGNFSLDMGMLFGNANQKKVKFW